MKNTLNIQFDQHRYKMMGKVKYILTATLVCLMGINASGQDIASSKLKWASNKTVDLLTGTSIDELNTVLTDGGGSLVWKNYDGTIRKRFQVIERIGEWTNINEDGKVQYEVTDGRISATISISRVADNVRIAIFMDLNPKEAFELNIESIISIQ